MAGHPVQSRASLPAPFQPGPYNFNCNLDRCGAEQMVRSRYTVRSPFSVACSSRAKKATSPLRG
jgi:hypothetical protein